MLRAFGKHTKPSDGDLKAFVKAVARTPRKEWPKTCGNILKPQRAEVLRWPIANLTIHLELIEDIALDVHTSFALDEDPEIAEIAKSDEYQLTIKQPTARGYVTQRLKERHEQGIVKYWKSVWRKRATPCMLS